MRLIDKAERKLGRFAIPSLGRVLAGFQVLVFVLCLVVPTLPNLLDLDPTRLMHGEFWRLITFIFLPRTDMILFFIISIMILIWVGDGLEQAWGVFRLNVYFFGTVACMAIAALLAIVAFPTYFSELANEVESLSPAGGIASYSSGIAAMLTGGYGASFLVFESLFLAYCAIAPEQMIMLMFVIPIRLRWLGLIIGGLVVMALFSAPVPGKLIVLASMIPLAVTFGPGLRQSLRQRSETASRRREFESKKLPESEAFHTCTRCNKTEHDDPDLEFRVSSKDGNEYCEPCLEIVKQETSAS